MLLTNASFFESGDHEGTLIVPCPPYTYAITRDGPPPTGLAECVCVGTVYSWPQDQHWKDGQSEPRRGERGQETPPAAEQKEEQDGQRELRLGKRRGKSHPRDGVVAGASGQERNGEGSQVDHRGLALNERHHHRQRHQRQLTEHQPRPPGQAGVPLKGADGTETPPTGKSFEVDFCTVARWDNGQIVEENLFYDLVTFMRQIGLG